MPSADRPFAERELAALTVIRAGEMRGEQRSEDHTELAEMPHRGPVPGEEQDHAQTEYHRADHRKERAREMTATRGVARQDRLRLLFAEQIFGLPVEHFPLQPGFLAHRPIPVELSWQECTVMREMVKLVGAKITRTV